MRTCSQCGFESIGEATFCGNCGSKLETVVAEEPKQEEPKQEEPKQEEPKQEEPKQEEPVAESVKKATKEKKVGEKTSKKGIWIAALVIVLIIAGIGGTYAFISANNSIGSEPIFVFQKDDELFLKLSIEDEPFQLTENLWKRDFPIDELYGYERFSFVSKDNKVLYYADKADAETATYYLMLLKNKNLEKLEKIKVDNEIYIDSCELTEDGKSFIYIADSSRELKVFNQTESITVDENVAYFGILDDKNIIYEKEDGGLYTVSLSDLEDTTKLADEYNTVEVDEEGRLIYDDGDSLVRYTFGGDAEVLVEDIYDIVSITKDGIYYTKEVENELKLTDYIMDDYAVSDKAMSEPVEPNFDDYYYDVWIEDWYYYDGGYWSEEYDWDAYDLDYANYTDAYYAYEEKLIRDEIRNQIKDYVLTVYNEELYFFDGENSNKISDSYYMNLASAQDSNMLAYQKNELTDFDKVNITEITEDTDLDAIIYDAYSTYEAVYLTNGKVELKLEDESSTNFYSGSKSIYFIDDYDYEQSFGDLIKVDIDKEGNLQTETIETEVNYYGFNNIENNALFLKDVDDNNVGMLYLDTNKIDDDVYLPSVNIIEGDTKFTYMVAFDSLNNYGEYVLYNGEDKLSFGLEANELVYYDDKHIFYLESFDTEDHEGDLMMFDGEKEILIEKDVQYFQ